MASNNSRNLSHIKSLNDLQSEIRNIKASLIVQEAQLKERRKQLPAAAKQYAIQKTVPAALQKVIPFLITKGAVFKSFGLIRNAVGLISVFKKQKDGTVKNKIVNTAKKVGVAAAVKGIFNFIKNRKQHSPSSQKIEVK